METALLFSLCKSKIHFFWQWSCYITFRNCVINLIALFSCNALLEEIIPSSFLSQLVEQFFVLKLIMEKFDIDDSLKNIPIPSNESYLIKLIDNIESVGKRMGWRANFFSQEKHKSDIRREDLRFKSKSTLPQCKHMEAFEKKFLDVISDIKLRSVNITFQKELKDDIPKTKTVSKRFCLCRQNK